MRTVSLCDHNVVKSNVTTKQSRDLEGEVTTAAVKDALLPQKNIHRII